MPTVSHGIFKWSIWHGATLETFADRLNHFWTCGLLLLLACIISWKHGYQKPITCWVPREYTKGMEQYAEETCWYQPLFYLPEDEDIPKYSLRSEMPRTRSLYQWLPIILCFQALLFKMPNLFMYILHGYSGISFEKIASLTRGFENMSMQERDILCKQTARYIYNWCKQFENWLPWRFLTVVWLIVKILYCINIIVQLSLVNTLLMSRDPPIKNSISYGDVIRRNLFSNDASLWVDSPAFPRHIMCDFRTIKLRSVTNWTVQCTLNANYFNEFVFMFLWVWFVFVAIATCLSLIIWTTTTIVPNFRKRYIKKAMKLADETNFTAIRSHDLDKFCDIIGEEGVMALKLIGANSSELLASNVVCNMWMLRAKGHSLLQTGPGQGLTLPEIQIQTSAPQSSRTLEGTKTE